MHGRGQRWLCVPLVILEDKEFELAVKLRWFTYTGVNWQILLYVKLKGSQLVLSASCELVWSTVSTVTIWGGWLGTEGGYACCFCATPDVV